MRLLVACPQCHRQFEATGRPIGGRFRCRCGAVLEIHQPKGHDSAVVRCSACGAPRQEGDKHCAFCGADFTLREQDLDTICPNCFARVSDRARFCDHCGKTLTAEPLEIKETPLICPVCRGDRRLSSRMIGGLAVLECPACAGLWVGNATLQQLLQEADKARDAAAAHPQALFAAKLVAGQHATRPHPRSTSSGQAGPLPEGEGAVVKPHGYLPCPECGEFMLRQNFGHGSGVVIDYCKAHGAWFDADKLTLALDWVRSGGIAAIEKQPLTEYQRAVHDELRVRKRAATASLDGKDDRTSEPSFWHWLSDEFDDGFRRWL